MTAIKAYNLWCNHPDCSRHGAATFFDYSGWPSWQTAAEVRAMAKIDGWKRTRDGQDICPAHTTDLTRKATQ